MSKLIAAGVVCTLTFALPYGVMAQVAGESGAEAVVDAAGDPAPPQSKGNDKNRGKPVAIFFVRQSVVARTGDEQHLKNGMSLHIAAMRGGIAIVEYAVKDGQVTYAVTSGSVNSKTRKAIEKAVAKMQKTM